MVFVVIALLVMCVTNVDAGDSDMVLISFCNS